VGRPAGPSIDPYKVHDFCCMVACAPVVKCARAYVKGFLMYHTTRHVVSTYAQSMTNGANYKGGIIHHSPWHSVIRTPNQLNTPQGRLSCPFQTKHSKHRRQ
jgi:hypothetical protein